MNGPPWRRLTAAEVGRLDREAVDPATLEGAAAIVHRVRREGQPAVRELAERFGEIEPGGDLVVRRNGLESALDALDSERRGVLERTAQRIEAFARAQLDVLRPVQVAVPGGAAGHQLAPVQRAGCYAPGGRYPLPSSVLMTAVTARVAGVNEVWVASPRPAMVTLAAAAVAGADALVVVGGAHAIAALAYGAGDIPACDIIVGPGNRWVTAAKQLVAGRVGIDMLAGPSELVVLADDSADPAVVAADLLAQAEHDSDALPVLVTASRVLVDKVEQELVDQLVNLPTREVAAAALGNGFAVLVRSLEEAIEVCNRMAPEHLQVLTEEPDRVASRLGAWGALFIGPSSAEVLGDYGAGPNHTLPTGGSARFTGGLSVLHFLRVRTWLRIDEPGRARELVQDSVALARLEGLEAHARAAEWRISEKES